MTDLGKSILRSREGNGIIKSMYLVKNDEVLHDDENP